jgi:rubredoxin
MISNHTDVQIDMVAITSSRCVCYFNLNHPDQIMRKPLMKTWMCTICGWIYDEAKGSPDDGIEPGTRWEDIPADWVCPECGAGKTDFEMIEI